MDRFSQSLLGQGDYADAGMLLPLARTSDGEIVLSFPQAIQGVGRTVGRATGILPMEYDAETGLPSEAALMDAFDAAGTVTGLGLLAGRPANSLGMGGSVKLPKKEVLDPMGYSDIKLDQFASDIQYDMAPRSLLIPEREIVAPEALQGSIMLFGPGDRSGVGLLKGVGDEKFDIPVEALGGRDYQRATPYAWASDEGIISGLLSRAKKAQEETGIEDVFLAHSTMNPQTIDFTEMMSSSVAELLKTAPISKAAAKSFDDEVRGTVVKKKVDGKEVNTTPFKDFPGVKSIKFREYMAGLPGEQRKTIIRLMDKSPRRKDGFPFIGKVRYALTEEAQRNVPTFASGMSFIPIDVAAGAVKKPMIPHASYNTAMGALGRPVEFGTTIPNDIFYRDFFKTLEGAVTKSGAPQTPAQKQYTTRLTGPYQVMDQQQVDRLSQFIAEGGI